MPALASALSEKYFGVAKLAKSFGHSKLPKVLATKAFNIGLSFVVCAL